MVDLYCAACGAGLSANIKKSAQRWVKLRLGKDKYVSPKFDPSLSRHPSLDRPAGAGIVRLPRSVSIQQLHLVEDRNGENDGRLTIKSRPYLHRVDAWTVVIEDVTDVRFQDELVIGNVGRDEGPGNRFNPGIGPGLCGKPASCLDRGRCRHVRGDLVGAAAELLLDLKLVPIVS